MVMMQTLIGSYAAAAAGATTLLATGTTTDTSFQLSGDSYNYPFSVSSGDSVVIAFAARVNGAFGSARGPSTYTVTDSAGNTWTQLASINQSNGLTQSAIFKCDLTASVTTSSTITISSTGTDNAEELGLGWFHFGTGTVSDIDTTTSQPAPSGTLSETVAMGGSTGTAIHVISTGLTSPPTNVNSSTGFTKLLEFTNSQSSTYIYYKENVTGNVTNTLAIPGGAWSSTMTGVA